ncbi:MAG TPA: hypothetical protein VGB49_09135, partial [Caulobacteraceae bacterium]
MRRSALLASALTAVMSLTTPVSQAQTAEPQRGAEAASAPGAAVAPAPRETVAAVAGRIRALYFDPDKGERLAAALEAEAAAGGFDALTDPRDLASALTNR